MSLILSFLTSCVLVVFPFSELQEKERFKGQSLLIDCLEEIPLSYSTKDKEPFLEAVNRIGGDELVLVTVQKRDKATYQFYYFQKTESIDGETAYLVTSDDFHDDSYTSAIYLKYKKKKHFFYRADCFRDKLKENEVLKTVLQHE
ncbi:MAG: hypothetical protein U5L96_10975 [Owenweeksia sp.]|nr:hypothetical protein [Owenweeksia sp.]